MSGDARAAEAPAACTRYRLEILRPLAYRPTHFRFGEGLGAFSLSSGVMSLSKTSGF